MLANSVHLYLYLVIITINRDVLNLPTKKHRAGWMDKQFCQYIAHKNSLQKKRYTQTEGEIMGKK